MLQKLRHYISTNSAKGGIKHKTKFKRQIQPKVKLYSHMLLYTR
jgi:hypothetical protein